MQNFVDFCYMGVGFHCQKLMQVQKEEWMRNESSCFFIQSHLEPYHFHPIKWKPESSEMYSTPLNAFSFCGTINLKRFWKLNKSVFERFTYIYKIKKNCFFNSDFSFVVTHPFSCCLNTIPVCSLKSGGRY